MQVYIDLSTINPGEKSNLFWVLCMDGYEDVPESGFLVIDEEYKTEVLNEIPVGAI